MRLCPTTQVNLRGHKVFKYCIKQTDVGIQVERIAYRPANFRLESYRPAFGGVVGEKDERCRIARDQLKRRSHLLVIAAAVKRRNIQRDGAIEQQRLDACFEVPHALGIEFATILRHDPEIESACLVTPGETYKTGQFAGVIVA